MEAVNFQNKRKEWDDNIKIHITEVGCENRS
jgi:hypothetical protein